MGRRTIILISVTMIALAVLVIGGLIPLYRPRVKVTHLITLGNGIDPYFSKDGSQILFASSKGLQIVHLNERRTENVGEPENLRGYQWLNPDEVIFRKVSLVSIEAPDTEFQFWVLNTISHEESSFSGMTFPNGIGTHDFDLSPSGGKIAFSAPVLRAIGKEKDRTLIHIMDIATRDVSPIDTPGEVYCVEPDWSPDETKIIYTCRDISKGVRNPLTEYVWITNLTTNYSERLTGLTDYRFFSWSPDDRWVAFTHNFSIWLAPVKNGVPDLNAKFYLPIRYNGRDSRFSSSRDFYYTPPLKVSWSPDSKSIAFAGQMNGRSGMEVWIAELEQ